jgi:hypothetical protein
MPGVLTHRCRDDQVRYTELTDNSASYEKRPQETQNLPVMLDFKPRTVRR